MLCVIVFYVYTCLAVSTCVLCVIVFYVSTCVVCDSVVRVYMCCTCIRTCLCRMRVFLFACVYIAMCSQPFRGKKAADLSGMMEESDAISFRDPRDPTPKPKKSTLGHNHAPSPPIIAPAYKEASGHNLRPPFIVPSYKEASGHNYFTRSKPHDFLNTHTSIERNHRVADLSNMVEGRMASKQNWSGEENVKHFISRDHTPERAPKRAKVAIVTPEIVRDKPRSKLIQLMSPKSPPHYKGGP